MPRHHDYNNFIASICLTYHLGQVKYVPGIIESEGPSTIRITSSFLLDSSEGIGQSPLGLEQIDLRKIGTDEDRYRQCLLGFLQDPRRSGKYALGPHTYTKVTSLFMKKLSYWYEELEGLRTFGERESVFSGKITSHDNIWILNDSRVAIDMHSHVAFDIYSSVDIDMEVFLLLGYIIFFLPKCSKSKRLLEHSKQQSFLSQYVIESCPERTALVRQAMQDYLERVGSEFPLEGGEDWDD